jgi:hypothetical protein
MPKISVQRDIEYLEIEIFSNYVSNIRSSIWRILSLMIENEYLEIASQLRRNVFYNLKLPLNDWNKILESTPFFNPQKSISTTYGVEIENAIAEINKSLGHIETLGNPLKVALTNLLLDDTCSLKIGFYIESKYREEVGYFLEGLNTKHSEIKLFSTLTEYKSLENFDALLFIGSIRLDDYTSLPNYFLRNKKFKHLIQFRWEGQKNDIAAFLSPVLRLRGILANEESHTQDVIAPPHKVQYELNTDDSVNKNFESSIDEVETYKRLTLDSFPALCFGLSEDKSVLLSPNSKGIFVVADLKHSLHPEVHHITATKAAEITTERVFFISFETPPDYAYQTEVHDVIYQNIWKGALLDQDLESFVGVLKRANLNLKNLESCVIDWCDISPSVVKAPQDKMNFKILLNCMKDCLLSDLNISNRDFDFWVEGAWKEVLASRSDAISHGLERSIEFEELLFEKLKVYFSDQKFENSSMTNTNHLIQIDNENFSINLFEICNVSFGYDVPKKLLRKVITKQESKFYK